LEAGSAAAYFRAWREVPLQWKGLNQRPIPENWRRIGSRTSLFKLAGNRNAAHPINAMLNYAYAILESQMRIQSVDEGYDPTLGIMHERREGSSAFVFDMMEPERPKVDRCILEFVKSHKFHATDLVVRTDGVVRRWSKGRWRFFPICVVNRQFFCDRSGSWWAQKRISVPSPLVKERIMRQKSTSRAKKTADLVVIETMLLNWDSNYRS
jgi:CRISPR associated protein Cas1